MVFWPPYPWYIDPLTHGILTPLSMVFWSPYPWNIDPPTHDILTSLPISWLEMGGWGVNIPWGFILPYRGESVFNKGVQYTVPWMKIDTGVNLPWGSKYHMTPGLVRCKREFQPLHLHILWIIPVKFCYNRTKKKSLKTKQYPMTSFTDLHISDLIKKLYIFHMSYLTFYLQTDTHSSQKDICIFDFI
jgi:hypothetical protein